MGSASQPMLVVKANRTLLRKRPSYKEIREAYAGYMSKADLKFKELTPFEQKKIRDKIIMQAKKDRMETIENYLIALFLVIGLAVGIYALIAG